MCHQECNTMSNVHEKMRCFGLLALRIALAFIFIYSGYGKLGPNHIVASGMFASLIGPESAGSFWAYFVGAAEFFGGLMLLLGVFARYAAIWLSIIMIVGIFTAHLGGPASGYFLSVALLGGTLAIMGSGAGCFRLVKTECHCSKCKTMVVGGCCKVDKKHEGGCCDGKK